MLAGINIIMRVFINIHLPNVYKYPRSLLDRDQMPLMRFSSVLISTVISPLDEQLRLKQSPMNPISPCTPFT